MKEKAKLMKLTCYLTSNQTINLFQEYVIKYQEIIKKNPHGHKYIMSLLICNSNTEASDL